MEKKLYDNQVIFSITEGLTANYVQSFQQFLEKELPEANEFEEFVLDLQQNSRIDSTGVTFVINVYKKIKAMNKTFSVIGANEDVQNLFCLMKLDKFFTMKN